MAGFGLYLTGLPNLMKRLKTIEDDLTKGVAQEISASTLKIERDAKRNAPVNFGTLRRSIHAESTLNGLTGKVIVDASYAPYVEFGTGGKVSVPSGYEAFAMQFKGVKSGTYYDFLMAIVEWIKRKGIRPNDATYSVKIPMKTIRRTGSKSQKFDQDVRMAERIAYAILKKGIRPQPFLIPAYEEEKPKLFNRLKKLLNA
jgi:HK97 gp10 family phage protein